MAILHGIISKMSGSDGNLTFQNSNGMTIVRERITQIRNPRSQAQMQTGPSSLTWYRCIEAFALFSILALKLSLTA